MKLTTAIARNLEPPTGKADHIEWDDDFPGFGVRLRAGRNRVSRMWVYQYDIAGRSRRITLGNVNAIGVDDARKTAGQLQSKVRLGDDPVLEKAEKLERAAHTFDNVVKNFLEVQKRTTRPMTYRVTSHVLAEPCKSLRPMSLPAITRRDIANVLTPIAARGKKVASNNVRSKLRTFFNWAIKQGLIENNPVLGTEKQETGPRTRVLSMAELVAISQALVDMTNYPTIIRLLMLTKQRRDETIHPQDRQWHDGIVKNMTAYSDMVHLLMLTGQRRVESANCDSPKSALRTPSSMKDCPLLVPPLCSHQSASRTAAGSSYP